MSRPQRHWDARAAFNFILGGSGAGLIVASVGVEPASPWPLALALGFIAAGLAAVWLEIGRKARALHVFFNPFTSWMTRESFAALVLFPVALGSMLSLRFVPVAALAAFVFLWCQARILRASRGIPAWRVREIVPLVICTGLAEGAGLALFFSQERAVLAWFALAVTARALAWARYRAAAKSAALEYAGRILLQAGTVGALACALIAVYAAPLAWIAAIAALCTGWGLKFVLITRAGAYAGFGLPRLPVRGAR